MEHPPVSIVIPVYNDPTGLQTTIDSLLENTHYSGEVEIIAVDNGSTDQTQSIAKRYTEVHDNISLETEADVQGSYAARNTGIEQATGDILVFLDADQRVTPKWLTKAINRITSGSNIHYLAPNIELEASESPSLIARYNLISGFPIDSFLSKHHYAPTSCLLVTRDLLDNVGSFDERLISGGDLEFGNRVYEAGYDLEYAPKSTVIHPTRNSFRALFKRNVRIGRGHCQLQRYYPERYGHVGIPPRPSGIRQDQYDASINRLLYRGITATMTAARGSGYYLECLRTVRERVSSEVRSFLNHN